METVPIWVWASFLGFMGAMMALDLGVFNRKAHVVSMREAGIWTAVWVSLALLFGLGVWREMGHAKALEFYTGYLIEESLSVDNLFVFLVLFRYFKVPPRFQHRVLVWGIIGAIVMRMAMILAGTAAIAKWHWIIYVFGVFLVYTGAKLMFEDGEGVDPRHNPAIKILRRFFPISHGYHAGHFFVRRRSGALAATMMMAVVLVVETTDVAFAVDSIPAVFAVTRDPFIVFTSNMFAIMGLRSIFFLLAELLPRFHLLRHGLSVVLMFIGIKMLIEKWVDIPIHVSLGVVGLTILGAILLSLVVADKNRGMKKAA
jgi:tellurite resistance protein TerC